MLNKLKEMRKSREEGFTLIELLIVIVIIGVLAAIALPIFSNQKTHAIEASAKSDLKNAATAIVTESTKNNGQYPTTLPASVTHSDGIVLKLKANGGALVSNPALNTSADPSQPEYLSWAQTEKKLLINTGESNLRVNYSANELTQLYYFYPKTSPWSSTQFVNYMKSVCTGATMGQGLTRQACQTESGYELNQSQMWNSALASGKLIGLIVTGTNDGEKLVALEMAGNPGTRPDINAYQGYKYKSGEAFDSSQLRYLAPIPLLVNVDSAVWGSPLDSTSNSYCIDATHESITSIKFHYDSNVGKIQEGTC